VGSLRRHTKCSLSHNYKVYDLSDPHSSTLWMVTTQQQRRTKRWNSEEEQKCLLAIPKSENKSAPQSKMFIIDLEKAFATTENIKRNRTMFIERAIQSGLRNPSVRTTVRHALTPQRHAGFLQNAGMSAFPLLWQINFSAIMPLAFRRKFFSTLGRWSDDRIVNTSIGWCGDRTRFGGLAKRIYFWRSKWENKHTKKGIRECVYIIFCCLRFLQKINKNITMNYKRDVRVK
jgi:hypothetical protein